MQVSEPSAKYMVKAAEYKQTEAGHIPADWRLGRLANVAQIRSGITKNSKAAIDNPVSVHYLRVANVQDGYLDLSDMSQLLVSQSDIKRHEVLPGDMLMNEGGDLDKLGRGALWRGKFSPCIHQNHVFVVRSGPQLIPEYLQAWTGSASAKNYFMLAGRQTTNLASINKTALGQLPIPLPTLEEQQAIATALSDTDALIDALEQLLAKKRQVKQGAMSALLTGKRRLAGFEIEPGYKNSEVGLIPIDWTTSTIGAEFFIQLGKMLDAEKNSGTPKNYIGNRSVQWGKIDMTSIGEIRLTAADINQFRLRIGDLLVCEGGEIGRAAIWEQPIEECYYQKALHRLRQKSNYNPHLLLNILQWLSNTGKFKNYATQTSIAHLPKDKFETIPIPKPKTTEEQNSIVAILSDMDTDITDLETRLGKVRQVKQGMMRELLTGRTRLV